MCEDQEFEVKLLTNFSDLAVPQLNELATPRYEVSPNRRNVQRGILLLRRS